jgi:hypothetical protein
VGERVQGFGLPGVVRHDCGRAVVRNVVRNMVNAGVPKRVVMKIAGHRTRAVFDRYDITGPADLQDAARKLNYTWGASRIEPRSR